MRYQTVFGAYNIVIHTVTGSSVHRTGTGIGSYMSSQYNRHIKIQERMFETLQFQFTSPAATDNLIIGYSGSCQRFLMKNFGINQLFRIFTVNLNQYIFKVRKTVPPFVLFRSFVICSKVPIFFAVSARAPTRRTPPFFSLLLLNPEAFSAFLSLFRRLDKGLCSPPAEV